MFVTAEVLIKAVEDRNYRRKDGTQGNLKNILVFGTQGNPADLALGIDDDKMHLFEQAKKMVYQRAVVTFDIRAINGINYLRAVEIKPKA